VLFLKFSIIAKLPEGGCCGKPDLAQGRGPNVEKLDEIMFERDRLSF